MKRVPKLPDIKMRVPENFDAEALARMHRNRSVDVPLLTDRLNWFVGQLISLGLRQDNRKDLEKTGYINLSTQVLTEVFRSAATTDEVIKILDTDVIERNHSYQTNTYSKGFRLLPQFMSAGLKSVEITTAKMKRSLVEAFTKHNDEKKQRLKTVSPLVTFVEDPELQVDMIKAHHFLEFWAYDLKEKVNELSSALDSDLVYELTHRVMAKIYYQKELLRRVEAGTRPCNRDETGLRLHSFVTSLKSPLRNFLTYRGRELVSVDLKASQPYLFTRLTEPGFWKKPGETHTNPYTLANLHPELYQYLTQTSVMDAIIMFTESVKTQAGRGFDGLSYSEIPWTDDFYQMVMDHTQSDFAGLHQVLNCYKDRQRTKYHNMLLFFDTKVTGRTTFRVPFEEYFPGVLRLMDMIRKTPGLPKRYKGKIVGEAKHNNLPVLLQRLESRLILDEICPAILKDHPDLFLLTIHDSIITVKGKEHIVEEYMARILQERIGVQPGLKVEFLNSSIPEVEWQKFIDREWDEMKKAVAARNRKTKKRLTNFNPVTLLKEFSRLGSEPLVKNVIPKQGVKELLSTRYLDNPSSNDDFVFDE